MSSFAVHSSLPVFESKARKRLSLVAPMNTKPPAVAMGPPMLKRPVFCLAGGNSSVTPSSTFQAISPVFAFTAIMWPHGGFWHGQAQGDQLAVRREENPRRNGSIAGPKGDSALGRVAVLQFIVPDFFPRFRLQSQDLLRIRQVHHAIDHNRRHFGAAGNAAGVVLPDLVRPRAREPGNVPCIDLRQR